MTPLGFIPLSRCCIRILKLKPRKGISRRGRTGRQYCFELYDPVRIFSKRHPTFNIFADDEEEMNAWIKALNLKSPVDLYATTPEGHLIDTNPIDKEGWLTKRGGIVKNWKRRWFVLQGNLIYYYKNERKVDPLGFIPVDRCTISVLNNPDDFKQRNISLPKKKQKYVFEVTDPCSAFNKWHKSYFLMAYSQEEMDKWIASILSVKFHSLNTSGGTSDSDKDSFRGSNAADELVVFLKEDKNPEEIARSYNLENKGVISASENAYLFKKTENTIPDIIETLEHDQGVRISRAFEAKAARHLRSFTLDMDAEAWADDDNDPLTDNLHRSGAGAGGGEGEGEESEHTLHRETASTSTDSDEDDKNRIEFGRNRLGAVRTHNTNNLTSTSLPNDAITTTPTTPTTPSTPSTTTGHTTQWGFRPKATTTGAGGGNLHRSHGSHGDDKVSTKQHQQAVDDSVVTKDTTTTNSEAPASSPTGEVEGGVGVAGGEKQKRVKRSKSDEGAEGRPRWGSFLGKISKKTLKNKAEEGKANNNNSRGMGSPPTSPASSSKKGHSEKKEGKKGGGGKDKEKERNDERLHFDDDEFEVVGFWRNGFLSMSKKLQVDDDEDLGLDVGTIEEVEEFDKKEKGKEKENEKEKEKETGKEKEKEKEKGIQQPQQQPQQQQQIEEEMIRLGPEGTRKEDRVLLCIVLTINFLDDMIEGQQHLFKLDLSDQYWLEKAKELLHAQKDEDLKDNIIQKTLGLLPIVLTEERQAHIAAALLLDLLTSLPVPLLPFYEEMMALKNVDLSDRVIWLRKLIESLPKNKRILLQCLLAFLGRLNEAQGPHKLSLSQLTSLFAGYLIRPPSATTTPSTQQPQHTTTTTTPNGWKGGIAQPRKPAGDAGASQLVEGSRASQGLSNLGYPLSPRSRDRMTADWGVLKEIVIQLITDFDLIFIVNDPLAETPISQN